MEENILFLKILEERFDRFLQSYSIMSGDFMSPEQQSQASGFFRRNRSQGAYLFGGYEEAERKMALFLPDYTGIETEDDILPWFSGNPDDCPLSVLEVTVPKAENFRPGHRDYLGALMGEGIKREKIGDIIIRPEGAQIIVMKDIGEYLADHLTSVGRASVSISVKAIDAIDPGEIKKEERRYNISSPRLDNVLSAVFNISRKSAQEAISKGLVFLDGIQQSKPDKQLSEDQKLVLRGKGKAIYRGISGTSKKGKVYITVEKYI